MILSMSIREIFIFDFCVGGIVTTVMINHINKLNKKYTKATAIRKEEPGINQQQKMAIYYAEKILKGE